jgi:EAL domain-containing protein (putative c-di-GMP-specific phosphodiesterase class I)
MSADQKVLESIVDVAHSLGKQTIAEVVEDLATLTALEDRGVDYAQGLHLGRLEVIWPRCSAMVPDAKQSPHRSDSATAVTIEGLVPSTPVPDFRERPGGIEPRAPRTRPHTAEHLRRQRQSVDALVGESNRPTSPMPLQSGGQSKEGYR